MEVPSSVSRQDRVFVLLRSAVSAGKLVKTTTRTPSRSCATTGDLYRIYQEEALNAGLHYRHLLGKKTFSQTLATRYTRVFANGSRWRGLALPTPPPPPTPPAITEEERAPIQ